MPATPLLRLLVCSLGGKTAGGNNGCWTSGGGGTGGGPGNGSHSDLGRGATTTGLFGGTTTGPTAFFGVLGGTTTGFGTTTTGSWIGGLVGAGFAGAGVAAALSSAAVPITCAGGGVFGGQGTFAGVAGVAACAAPTGGGLAFAGGPCGCFGMLIVLIAALDRVPGFPSLMAIVATQCSTVQYNATLALVLEPE